MNYEILNILTRRSNFLTLKTIQFEIV